MEKRKKEEQNPRLSLLMLEIHKVFVRQSLADVIFQIPNSKPKTTKPKTIREWFEKNKNYFEYRDAYAKYIEAYDKECDKLKAKLKRKIKAENKKSLQKNEPSI